MSSHYVPVEVRHLVVEGGFASPVGFDFTFQSLGVDFENPVSSQNARLCPVIASCSGSRNSSSDFKLD